MNRRSLRRTFRHWRGNRGSALIMVMLLMLVVSFIIMFAITSSKDDTQLAFRRIRSVQAKYLAEGALQRAKGDVLGQVAATNFLGGGAFETVAEKYANVNSRFATTRIPASVEAKDIDWKATGTIAQAAWNFADDANLNVANTNTWGPGASGNPLGDVRVFVTRSFIDEDGDAAMNAVGSYSITITAWASVGQSTPFTTLQSKTFHHQLSFPRLYDYLLLGNRISDCSMCHLKLWGDVAQVDPTDPFRLHIGYNANRFFRLSMYGTMFLNGDFLRTCRSEGVPDNNRQEKMLWTPGQDMFIYAKNGGALSSQWTSDGSASQMPGNPFRSIDSLPPEKRLPTTWPSVKANLMNWFEPRNMAGASSNQSDLRVAHVLDNNLVLPSPAHVAAAQAVPAFRAWNNAAPSVSSGVLSATSTNEGNSFQSTVQGSAPGVGTTAAVTRNTFQFGYPMPTDYNATSNPNYYYRQAIDRAPWHTASTSTGTTLFDQNNNLQYYDRGLHPADDLDNDTIPNIFDADLDGDGTPETPRASENTNDAAYHLTTAASAVVAAMTPITSMPANNTWTRPNGSPSMMIRAGASPTTYWQWRLGYVLNPSPSRWERCSTAHASGSYRRQIMNLARSNQDALSWCYTAHNITYSNPAQDAYRWSAEVTGIAETLRRLLNNQQASTATSPRPGVIKGVFPGPDVDAQGNPDYSINGGRRNLIAIGSQRNPMTVAGQLTVRGDLFLMGYIGGRGSIVTHRNTFLPMDIRYVDPPNWNDVNDKTGDMVGIVSGGNILVGNVWHNTSARTDIGEFVWGNMININDPGVASWNWGSDGTSNPQANHMVNPVYLPDGAEGGRWENGEWKVENQGNLVSDVYNGSGMKVGGGLVANTTTNPYFNPNRKHLNFTGNSNPSTTNDNTSVFKNYYISTPGLLPLGATAMTAFPTDSRNFTFANATGWMNSDDFNFFTLWPRNASNNRTNDIGSQVNTSGATLTSNFRWLRVVESVLYADYGVVGGNIPTTGPNFLEFRGTVIGRDIQLLSAIQNNSGNTETKFTNNVAGLYYDWRLKGAINPFGFPFDEGFVGGEMTMNYLPDPGSWGDRDQWRPFRMTPEFQTLYEWRP